MGACCGKAAGQCWDRRRGMCCFCFFVFCPRPACDWTRAHPGVFGRGSPSCGWTPTSPKFLSSAGWPHQSYGSIISGVPSGIVRCLMRPLSPARRPDKRREHGLAAKCVKHQPQNVLSLSKLTAVCFQKNWPGKPEIVSGIRHFRGQNS
jgi:hypothetical protein